LRLQVIPEGSEDDGKFVVGIVLADPTNEGRREGSTPKTGQSMGYNGFLNLQNLMYK
jgi:hypothetical protein